MLLKQFDGLFYGVPTNENLSRYGHNGCVICRIKHIIDDRQSEGINTDHVGTKRRCERGSSREARIRESGSRRFAGKDPTVGEDGARIRVSSAAVHVDRRRGASRPTYRLIRAGIGSRGMFNLAVGTATVFVIHVAVVAGLGATIG